MKDYTQMTPYELQMDIMSEVSNMLEAIRTNQYEKLISTVQNYSMALQQLTYLANQHDKR